MLTLWRDVRFTFRSLAKNWTFTVAAVTALGLGIGATSTTFSFIRPFVTGLPMVDQQDRLMFVWSANVARGTDKSDPAFIQKDEASRVERRGSRRPLRAGGRDVGAIVFGRAYRFFYGKAQPRPAKSSPDWRTYPGRPVGRRGCGPVARGSRPRACAAGTRAPDAARNAAGAGRLRRFPAAVV